ncbi:MAG: RnfH family protein [Parahaliea sp.]
MGQQNMITVEVAYALPHQQALITVQVAEGSTAIDAVHLSGIEGRFDNLSVDEARLGVFGKAVSPQAVLRAGDRVEIYRPLIADPKEVRKTRAARTKAKD